MAGWTDTVIPSLLQNDMHDFCLALEEVLEDTSESQGDHGTRVDDQGVWLAIR